MAGVDFNTLGKALAQLETSLAFSASDEARDDATRAQVFRSAAIQGFEFTFELSHEVLRRYVAETEATAAVVEELSFPDLMRLGYARGVISRPWAHWLEFRRLRALTSHTYTEASAAEVFRAIPDFTGEIRKMIAFMQKAPPP